MICPPFTRAQHGFSLLVVAVLAMPAPAAVPADHAEKLARGKDLFVRHVRQLLTDRCLKCHGGDKTRSGLDLHARETLLKGGDNGAVVVPFKSKDSRLLKLVAHLQAPHMPPKEARLAEAQIAWLTQWIDLGAPYDRPLLDRAAIVKKPLVVTEEDRRFWSFLPLGRPAVPAVKNQSWVRTPIDAFLLARLEQKGLAPNPIADKRKLIRRVSFDLIGLPPTPDEIDVFLKDEAPGAYEKVIDRLLASPHHGERWARHWLDLARFAESHGFEHDYDRPTAYHYRDFVIKALNLDLPYDKFVQWQIAGDEMEPDNPLALTATGFLAAGVHSTQITANLVEKERYDKLDDIVRTIGTGMLGLTIGCARCHDHKYDPIPTRDYYRMLSTFTTTVRTEIDLKLDARVYETAKAKWDAEYARIAAPRTRYESDELPAKLDQWLASRRATPPAAPWAILTLSKTQSRGDAQFLKQPDGSWLLTGLNPEHDRWTLEASTQALGITSIRLEALADPSLVKGGPGRASNGNFALSDFRVTATPLKGGPGVPIKLVGARATFEQNGLPVKAAIDGDKVSAWAVDPQLGKSHAAVFDAEKPFGFDGGTLLTFTLEFNNNTGHGIGRPRLAISTKTAPVAIDGPALPTEVQGILALLSAKTDAQLTVAQRAALLSWYRTQDPRWLELSRPVAEHEKRAPKPATIKALICSEGLPPVRLHSQGADFFTETFFLNRGDPNQKQGVAGQAFPQVLVRAVDADKHWQIAPPPGCRTSYRRRSLAKWITDVDQGAGHLLARVIVNRLWQHHFGRGLVGTPSDFGLQGERPTHPELLDFLARELIEHGWSLKHIHKLILSSSVYMQNTHPDSARAKLDPDNRLLWRRVPTRLEAEVIRDNLLAVSGILDRRPFGPGTLDPNMKRRSIYFTVKRSQLIGSMVLFDAPDGLQGVEQRTTTTIAPQALLLMNNPLVRDCAKQLAARIAPSGSDAVRHGFQLALGRLPTVEETETSSRFVQDQMDEYKKAGKDNPSALALTDFAQALLGLNEFVYID